MHKLLISTIFAATTVTTFPSEAKSKLERHICRGEFTTGSLDSGIGDCVFISHDPTTHLSTTFNRKITCQMNNDCEVEAWAAKNGNGDWSIEKVISVKDHGPMKR